MSVRFIPLANINGKGGEKGPQGPAGTFASASGHTLPAGENATVETSGPETAKHLEIGVPRGLPGTNALANDEAFATYINALDSDTSAALLERFTPKGTFFVNVADLGAPLDGSADDTVPIQDAIDAWSGSFGVLKLTAPPGSTIRTDGWTVEGKDVLFDFSHSHVTKTSSSPILYAVGSWGAPVSVGDVSNATSAATLTVADTTGFQVGDLVKVFSDDVIWDSRQRESMGDSLYRQGEFVTVEAVTGSTLLVSPSLVDEYSTNVRVAKLNRHVVDFRFGTADFDAAAGGGGGQGFLREMFIYESLWSPNLEGHILAQPGGTIRVRSCYAATCDVQIDDAPEGDGYGVDDNGSCFGDYNIIMRRGRHAFTDNPPRTTPGDPDPGMYGRSMRATIRGKSMGLMQAHWDTHHGGYGHKFIGVSATGSPTSGAPGFSLRGQRHEFIACTADGMQVGFRFHNEEAATWATSQHHVMTDCVTRAVGQAIECNLNGDADRATVPTVTINGGVFETIASVPLYARRANVFLNDVTFRIERWSSSFAAPFIVARSKLVGSMRVINAVGELGTETIIRADNSTPPSRVDLDVYYLSEDASGDGLTGFLYANNAISSVRLRTMRPFPPSVVMGTSLAPTQASGTHVSQEGDDPGTSSALYRRTLTDGETIGTRRSADPFVMVVASASTNITVSGMDRGAHGGQVVVIANYHASPGTITIPWSGTNLGALGGDIVIAPGDSVTLAWNSAPPGKSWVRVS